MAAKGSFKDWQDCEGRNESQTKCRENITDRKPTQDELQIASNGTPKILKKDVVTKKVEELSENAMKSESLVGKGSLLEGNLTGRIINGIVLSSPSVKSKENCNSYTGIELASGKLLYVTEWKVKNRHIKDIKDVLKTMVHDLKELRHRNLIGYEGVFFNEKRDELQVFLTQEFIPGISVLKIPGGFNWSSKYVSKVVTGVLDALTFLCDKNYYHGNISGSTVLIDNTGNIKVTDFYIVPYLRGMTGDVEKTFDLPSLGALLALLVLNPNSDMQSFIKQCNSEDTTVSDLRQSISSKSNIESQFEKDFMKLAELGKGAYGTVFKVQNKLDKQLYAVKKVKLNLHSKHNFDVMMREVTLLSKLNHKNVVRYYSSWTEMVEDNDSDCEDSSEEDNSDVVVFADQSSSGVLDLNKSSYMSKYDDSDVVVFSEQSSCGLNRRKSIQNDNDDEAVVKMKTFLYIQMEYCEGQTLKAAIDNNLYLEEKRRFRLFRHIVMGLSHIHSLKIIHRDLKPDNIFLNSRDRLKIGDFGLATTCDLALRHQHVGNIQSLNYTGSLTGYVGTPLYAAPELSEHAYKSNYNEKADMFSLGIIFLEMCSPPSTTAMERMKIIEAARKPEINLPKELVQNSNNAIEIQLLRMLLDHKPEKRPESNKLLNTKLVCSKTFPSFKKNRKR